MPTSVRLDPDSERLLEALARESGRTKSEVIRDALRAMDAGERSSTPPDDLRALVSDLIGLDDRPGEPAARDHKRVFRERLILRDPRH